MPMVDDYATGLTSAEPPRRRRWIWLALALLAAVALGGAAALWGGMRLGWIVWHGWNAPGEAPRPMAAASPLPPAPPPPPPVDEQAQAALGVRIAELEQRMARLDVQTVAAENNAARAEALMIAFAARRAIERGLPLGALETQLRLRFGDAQPNAVATVVAAAARPVTRASLLAELNALAPRLASPTAPGGSAWARFQSALRGLFVVRKADEPSPLPERRLERARANLESGLVEAAIRDVERLPAREAASAWLQEARNLVAVQRALDLIEAAALLDTRPAAPMASSPLPALPEPVPTPESPAEPALM
jgi:hypothetical protein